MTPQDFNDQLIAEGYRFITGVPDSIFKPLLIAMNQDKRFQHVITNNEGESCALAAGHYLATREVPVVYMQNSGLGNAINPLTSLLDPYIYAIPTLLLIAWRGMPGTKDEPQHVRMGEVLPGMLSLLDINYAIASKDAAGLPLIFEKARQHFALHQKPYAILFPKGAISANANDGEIVVDRQDIQSDIIRETLLERLVDCTSANDVLVTTTGKTSRELYEIRERLNQPHGCDFLTVGSMGCASTIGLGIALQQKDKRVIVVDGDGSCLMRMEALATIGHQSPRNLLHIIVDNNAYESTGNQETLSHTVDLLGVAKACGYSNLIKVNSLDAFKDAVTKATDGPTLLLVPAKPFSRADLGRPKSTPIENKQAFMDYLGV